MKVETGRQIATLSGKLLREKKLSLSVAESCTGGSVGNLVTSVPGSSDYFKGGVIAYSNEAKRTLLSVPRDIIREYGAVSTQVAVTMAEGVRNILKTDIGISTTGIAGPGGGSSMKRVGMVVLGIDIKGKITTNIEYFEPPRERIKESAAITLLKLLVNRMERIQ